MKNENRKVAKSQAAPKKAIVKSTFLKKPIYKAPVYTVLDKMPNLKAVKDHPHYLLFEMLTWMRPDGTLAEQAFCNKYIKPVTSHQDAYGNYHLIINQKGNLPPTVLFSSHTDSVHHTGGFQNLEYDREQDIIMSKNSSCLGSDDATGIYIMLRMIKAKIPGHYIFHRAEEVGCKGSQWIHDSTPEIFDDIDMAVAFDRKGEEAIITHQSTGKCASDECALELADHLNMTGLDMSPSSEGVYTDTAHYNDLVSECFNLAVGYYRQHFPEERQHLDFLTKFLDACLATPWHEVKTYRDVKDIKDAFDLDWGDDGWGYPTAKEIMRVMEKSPKAFAEYMADCAVFSYADLETILEDYTDDDDEDDEVVASSDLSQLDFSGFFNEGDEIRDQADDGYDPFEDPLVDMKDLTYSI